MLIDYNSWEDELERSGWSFGLSAQKQMLSDWQTDRAEWRSLLKEARRDIERLQEQLKEQRAVKSDRC